MKRILILILILIPFVSASSVSILQGQHYVGTTFQTGIATFNFTVYDSYINGNVCFSNETNLTRGSFGEWYSEQSISENCTNSSIDYFLELRIDDTLQEINPQEDTRARLTIYDFLRRDVEDTKLGDLIVGGIVKGLSPLKLTESLVFLNETDNVHFSIYHSHIGEDFNDVPNDFDNALILQTEAVGNPYNIEMGVWDKPNQKFLQIWNTGLNERAHTFIGSVQIKHGNKSITAQNGSITLCDEANYVDCDSRITGADLYVNDDIEAGGSIYSNENITAKKLDIQNGSAFINGSSTAVEVLSVYGYGTEWAGMGIHAGKQGLKPYLELYEYGNQKSVYTYYEPELQEWVFAMENDILFRMTNETNTISGGNSTADYFLGKWNGSIDYYNSTQIDNFGFYNSTNFYIDDYYLKNNSYEFWNDTFATFNKTYADTLFAGIEWDYNQTIPANTYTDNQISLVNITNKNITIGQKITFAFGEIIDNIINGWIRIIGNLNVTGNLEVGGYANISGTLKANELITGTLSLECDSVNITGGNITYSAFYMSVLGEGGVNDDLNYILGGDEGDVLNIFPTDAGSDILLVDGVGNLNLGGANCALKSIGTKAELRKIDSDWKLIICAT